MNKYQKRINEVLTKLMKSAPSYAMGTISDYRNKRFDVSTVNNLPYWSNKIPRAPKAIPTLCLYALLTALIIADEHFNKTNENEIKILTYLKAAEKVAGMKWWVLGRQELVGDDKKGYTFGGLNGV